MRPHAMKARVRLPCFGDLHDNPHLGVLTLLEAAIDVALPALAAAYPELTAVDANRAAPSEINAVLRVVDLARALAITLHEYRRALRAADARRQRLLPF